VTRSRVDGEHGRVSVFLAIALAGVLILIGMVADGGARLRAMQRADNIAAEAARAAGQGIDGGKAIPGGDKELDPELASQAAREYLAAAGVPGTAVVDEGGQQVTIEVTITRDTAMLSLIGINTIQVTGRATAVLRTE
jgi:Flp pilus assembly protein TadG